MTLQKSGESSLENVVWLHHSPDCAGIIYFLLDQPTPTWQKNTVVSD